MERGLGNTLRPCLKRRKPWWGGARWQGAYPAGVRLGGPHKEREGRNRQGRGGRKGERSKATAGQKKGGREGERKERILLRRLDRIF